MLGIKDSWQRLGWRNVVRFASLALFALWSLGFTRTLLAQPPGHKTFSSPAEATRALFLAAQAGDEKALLEIFGPDGKELISSGDVVEDKDRRDQFVRKYREMNRLVQEPDGTMKLYIGAENWPMPIPLVNRDGAWYFNTGAGKEEILFRRIGRNEIAASRVLQELVDAQRNIIPKHVTTQLNSMRRSSSAIRTNTMACIGRRAMAKLNALLGLWLRMPVAKATQRIRTSAPARFGAIITVS